MFPSTCSMEALLACPPCPLWNLPSFTVESTLLTPCSRSDLPHSRQGASLAHLDSLPLMIWYSGLTAFILFSLGEGGSGVPANCSLCSTEGTFPFRQAQYVPVFPLRSAPFCTLFAGLGSTNKSAISLIFSHYLTLVLSSRLCSFLSSMFPLT